MSLHKKLHKINDKISHYTNLLSQKTEEINKLKLNTTEQI